MLVKPIKSGLIIIPENYYERVYLQSFMNCDQEIVLKHDSAGLDEDNVLGLIIKIRKSSFGEKVHSILHSNEKKKKKKKKGRNNMLTKDSIESLKNLTTEIETVQLIIDEIDIKLSQPRATIYCRLGSNGLHVLYGGKYVNNILEELKQVQNTKLSELLTNFKNELKDIKNKLNKEEEEEEEEKEG